MKTNYLFIIIDSKDKYSNGYLKNPIFLSNGLVFKYNKNFTFTKLTDGKDIFLYY